MKVCGHPEDAEDTMQEVLSVLSGTLPNSDSAADSGLALHCNSETDVGACAGKPAHAPAHLLSLDNWMFVDGDELVLLEDARQIWKRTSRRRATPPAASGNPSHPTFRIVLVLHDMEELTTEQAAQVLCFSWNGTDSPASGATQRAQEMSQLLKAIPELPKTSQTLHEQAQKHLSQRRTTPEGMPRSVRQSIRVSGWPRNH